MHRGMPILIAAALCGTLAALANEPALAAGTSLQICNQTSTAISVAVSYVSRGENDTATTLTGPTVSVGWWGVQPNACSSMANPFAARYMYWWGYYVGGSFLWTGNDNSYGFCIPNPYGSQLPQFTYEDQNASEDACTSAAPGDTYGPNVWVHSREVDLDVNATVDYSGQ